MHSSDFTTEYLDPLICVGIVGFLLLVGLIALEVAKKRRAAAWRKARGASPPPNPPQTGSRS